MKNRSEEALADIEYSQHRVLQARGYEFDGLTGENLPVVDQHLRAIVKTGKET